jgi:hypothetical protein
MLPIRPAIPLHSSCKIAITLIDPRRALLAAKSGVLGRLRDGETGDVAEAKIKSSEVVLSPFVSASSSR